jgi:endonuclease YncB( thermonuclease family)
MGDLLPFRKRPKTWTKPEDYSRGDWGRVLPTRTWRGEPRRGPGRLARLWRAGRWWLALIALAGLWVLYRDAARFDPPAFLEGKSVKVAGDWTLCGPGRGPLCVVDGDTLKLGERRVRIVGLDAPEAEARCAAEAEGAKRAAAVLLRWVNAAPFELVPRLDSPTDKWGRELMTARRTGPGGRSETAADVLIEAGVARPYTGDARLGWC